MPIYYESRVAKLGLNASELPKIDAEFEAIIRQLPDEEQEDKARKLKTKWAALEALVGNPKRIDNSHIGLQSGNEDNRGCR